MPKSDDKREEKMKATPEVDAESKHRLLKAQYATSAEAEKLRTKGIFSHPSEKKLEELNEHDLRNFIIILHKDMVTKKQYGFLDKTPDKITKAISEKIHSFKDTLQIQISGKVAEIIEETNKAIARLGSFNGDSDGTRERILLADKNSKHIFVYALDKALKNGKSDGERIQIIYNQLKNYTKPNFTFNLKAACAAIFVNPKLLKESPKTDSEKRHSQSP